MIKIVVDLDGADKSSNMLFSGVKAALEKYDDLSVYVLSKDNLESNHERMTVIKCSDIVTNFDNPVMALTEKTDSSLIKGMNLVKEECDGFVSLGSTGGVYVSSLSILGSINHLRPALLCNLPSDSVNGTCICDCGANIDAKSVHLVQFAKMAAIYQEIMGVKNPKVGLLSNGSEKKKGNKLVLQTHELLLNSNLNFIGNVEATECLTDKCDCLVCDGFDGNIILKNVEGTAKKVIEDIKRLSDTEIANNLCDKLLKKYDFNTIGGAVLLGVSKPVVKGHGAGTNETVTSIIDICYKLAKENIVKRLTEEFER